MSTGDVHSESNRGPVKIILLFDKTGDSKSTVAYMLTKEYVEGDFAAGNSLAAVKTQTNEALTDENWIVVDTVGVFATDKPEKDLKRILELRNYLAENHHYVDVIYYLKKASKFTRSDDQCWRVYHSLFVDNEEERRSYHGNVLLIFTSCGQKAWLDENVGLIDDKMAGPTTTTTPEADE